ncbi:CDP-alcohol phosphatidyltransferase family protein [Bacteroides caecigallinarum]|uniref:CDP-alcohol phosphatidyltransferase family protein n=1 Tax=Bacteroides caecigallinarum TaxID=1411144 RepID=UPI001957A45C|nr:CDP-alcohol phosphatidyltransferase family protein [Bacteroides caecigallinarum]MBM6960215.1 CDP-alcohol phosphatidyltransferase family protein [Bacteroides caecigallinarum]
MKEKSSETSVRIQTSILNGVEKKALAFLADRQPRWMTSNILTGIGTFGAIVISLGYILSQININYLWLSSLGFVINWYGDSLDGTLARVRNKQRPIFGYYIDHTVDIINELLIFLGLGLSGLICFDLSLFILIVYMMLTLNVSINAHLKKEFRLTYAKLGPTEFRVLAIIFNTVCIYCPAISDSVMEISMFGKDIVLGSLDIAGVFVLLVLIIMYIVTVLNDIKDYDKIDPMK